MWSSVYDFVKFVHETIKNTNVRLTNDKISKEPPRCRFEWKIIIIILH